MGAGDANPAARASSSLIASTSVQDVNSTSPIGVSCVWPTFTRGLSQRRKASVVVPAAIPSRSAGRNSTR